MKLEENIQHSTTKINQNKNIQMNFHPREKIRIQEIGIQMNNRRNYKQS